MEALKKNQNKIITLKQARKVVILLVCILFFEFLLFPAPLIAGQMEKSNNISQEQGIISSQNEVNQDILVNIMEFNGKLPESEGAEIEFSRHITITAYNSEVGQTDDSPCITANGFNVCNYGIEDTIAANFLPFGSKVKIPALFGDRIFVVRDRMNKRFSNRVDVWMIERPDAVNFGVKIAKIEVLK
ncbi:MAG: hypothetical protein Q8O59_04870 [bacterium]|nr:hypothetical protein [bacterium]